MTTLFNLTALKHEMDEYPKGQRINNFFEGAFSQLTDAQKKNLITIINKHHDDVIEFIESSIEDKNYEEKEAIQS